jgi:hypothetical protein
MHAYFLSVHLFWFYDEDPLRSAGTVASLTFQGRKSSTRFTGWSAMSQYVAQVCLGIKTIQLGAFGQAVDGSGTFAARIRSGKQADP